MTTTLTVNGTTHTVDGEIVPCKNGLHSSERPIDALRYARNGIVWRTRSSGTIVRGDDQIAASERAYLARLDATAILRDFARKCALDVIHLWDAPDVVRRFLETGDESLRDAARDAAWDARDAAWDAMDAAWDKNSGQIDAVKFAAFFDDKPGLKPFMTASTQKHIDGLKKLFTESALRAGEAPKVSMPGSHSSHPIMAALGIGSVLAGHVGRGMTEIAGALGAAPAFKLVERLMNDSFGRNLLAAAAVAKPGSPRMGRIMQTVATKFLPIAAGQEGAREAGPQPRQARPGGGLL